MSDTLGVSHTALVIRLRDLGALDFHPIEEYVVKEFRLEAKSNEIFQVPRIQRKGDIGLSL